MATALTSDERERIGMRIMRQYSLDDFKESNPDHLRGALAFIDILAFFTKSDVLDVKIVPGQHVSSQSRSKEVAIVYEGCTREAEIIQGLDVAPRALQERAETAHNKLKLVEDQYDMFFECINHWSTAVVPL
jgi:hypothetical protein